MATITTTCPECKKQIKIPTDVVGKKIKCKGCGNAFVATTTAVQSTDPRAKEKASEIYKPVDDEEEYGDGKAYGVSDLDLDPRCPECAYEMESREATVCLHCGYNIETRTKSDTRRVKDPTGEDWFWWLLPPILCVLLFLTCFAGLIDRIVEYAMFGEEQKNKVAIDYTEMLKPCVPCWYLWGSIFCLWIMWLTGKYAFNRLVYKFRPPEEEIK